MIHREATRAGTDGPEMPVPATAQYGIIMGYEGCQWRINIYIMYNIYIYIIYYISYIIDYIFYIILYIY